jgi:O-antigen/teichoic acid export membrane protein
MGLAQRFLRGSVLNLFEQGLRFAAVFVMGPILVGILGKPDYGFWVLLMSILGHYSLLDFGMSASITRFFARAIGKGDDGELSILVSTSFSILLKIGIGALVVTAVCLAIVPLFGISEEREVIARWVILLYGLFLAAGFPVGVFRSLLKSHMRYDLLVLASSIRIVLGNVLIYFFLKQGHGLITLAVINASVGFLEYAIVLVVTWRSSTLGVGFSRALVDPGRRSEILGYSSVMFVNSLGKRLRSAVDPVIIAAVIGDVSVAIYSIGTRFPIFLVDIVGAVLGGQLLAVFSQSQGKTGSTKDSIRKFIMATRLSTIISVFCGSSLIFYGYQFLQRWISASMGSDFQISYQILSILTVPYMFALMQYPSINYINSLAQHRYLAITGIIAGVGNVVLSLVLVRFFGIYGVVWATFVEMLVTYMIVYPMIICRLGRVSPEDFYVRSLAHPMVISLLILIPFFSLTYPFREANYPRLVLLSTFQFLYFAPLAFFFVLRKPERAILLSALRRSSENS